MCVPGHSTFSDLAVSVFCLPPPSGSFCFVAMYVSQLASDSSLCLPKAWSLMLGTWVVLFPLWTGPTALSWSWAWLIHPCHSTFRAQLRSCPLCPLVSCVLKLPEWGAPSSLPSALRFRGQRQACSRGLCAVTATRRLEHLVLLIGLCP